MQIKRTMAMAGSLGVKVNRKNKNWGWRIRNMLRWSFLKGYLGWVFFAPLARRFNVMTAMGRLGILVTRANGQQEFLGWVSYNVITNAGVAFLVDDWDADGTDITNMNYHGAGTDNTAENASDTALGAESTTALNPDSTRATGTKSQPSANVLQSVGTLLFDASAAIVEHGLLSQAATGGGTLWDRSVFSVINVGSGDSIQFTYQCTVSAGG